MRTERFQGKIGRTLAESEPWFEELPHPGEAAPNVVVVLLDDTGFAQMGCFGSEIDTPNIDALAAGGLQFTNFHVTPLCSPTRAALLTGRSQHKAGMRSVSNFRTGFPHMLGHVSTRTATNYQRSRRKSRRTSNRASPRVVRNTTRCASSQPRTAVSHSQRTGNSDRARCSGVRS